MIYRYETRPALGMTWLSEFRSQGEGLAYTLRPEPVMYSPFHKPARKGFLLGVILMKLFKQARRFGTQVVATSAAGVGAASAALPTAVTDATTAAGTDGVSMGAAVLVVIVGIVAFKYIRKAL